VHQQKLQDHNDRSVPRPHNPNGNPHNITSVSAPQIAPNNILSSQTVDQTQNFEAENTPLSILVQDIPDANTANIPSQLHPGINLNEYILDFASHGGLVYKDVKMSSPFLEYSTESDPLDVNLDVFTGIWNDINDWESFFNPSTKGQLSTVGYLTPFDDFQPLPL
jgi:hypothetical protein